MNNRPSSITRAQFFEYGEVFLEASDRDTRQASLRICIPCCLMQTLTPVLLGAGVLDRYELRNPVAAWIPIIGVERYVQGTREKAPQLPKIAAQEMRKKTQEVLEFFREMAQTLQDPTDMIPLLPMGTYVKFRYRCTVDKLTHALILMEQFNVVGVPEFRFAVARILAGILSAWG